MTVNRIIVHHMIKKQRSTSASIKFRDTVLDISSEDSLKLESFF